MAKTPYTPAGNPIGDNQNSITADANRPVPLQDYHLIEKAGAPESRAHPSMPADISKYTKTSNLVERIMKDDFPRITTASASRIFRTCFSPRRQYGERL